MRHRVVRRPFVVHAGHAIDHWPVRLRRDLVRGGPAAAARHRLDGPHLAARPVRRRSSSGSASSSSSSSAGCSSRSCRATPCSSRSASSSPPVRSTSSQVVEGVELVLAFVAADGRGLPRQRRGLRDRPQASVHRSTSATAGSSSGSTSTRRSVFFDKHGNKALVIGRFVPFVRTYITVVAGVTRMHRRRFFLWSFVGALLWVGRITLARLLPGLGLPRARREHRHGDPRDHVVLGHPDRLRVVAAPARVAAPEPTARTPTGDPTATRWAPRPTRPGSGRRPGRPW